MQDETILLEEHQMRTNDASLGKVRYYTSVHKTRFFQNVRYFFREFLVPREAALAADLIAA